MLIKTLLNQIENYKGCVYKDVRLEQGGVLRLLVTIRPDNRCPKGICSGYDQPGPCHQTSKSPRYFEFVPLWGILVFFAYRMRRINCPRCGIKVEKVPGLKAAVEWGVIEHMPVVIKRLKVVKPEMDFFDFPEFETLVEVAAKIDQRTLLLTLLGGAAGLRVGEIRALEWTAIDFRRQSLTINKSEWEGHVTLPKHDKIRQVPMTRRLTRALKQHRHLQEPRVLYLEDAEPLGSHTLRRWLVTLCRRANLRYRSPHSLRHTFVRIWRCVAHQRGRSRSWLGTLIS